MMNDCPDVNEEALLSVAWGEPAFLQVQRGAHYLLLVAANGELASTRFLPETEEQSADKRDTKTSEPGP